jgi:hypothetical protein
MRICSLAILVSMIGCGGAEPVQTLTTPVGDTASGGDGSAPTILHSVVEAAQTYGEDVPMSATVNDVDGDLFVVRVYYRSETSTEWQNSGLSGDLKAGFSGKIPANDVSSAGMYYYLYAIDLEQNETMLPINGDVTPWHFRIALADTGL